LYLAKISHYRDNSAGCTLPAIKHEFVTSPLNSQEEEEACVPHSLGISPEMEVTLRTDMNMVTCHGH